MSEAAELLQDPVELTPEQQEARDKQLAEIKAFREKINTDPEPAINLVLQSLNYAAEVVMAIEKTPFNTVALQLIGTLAGLFGGEILPRLTPKPVDAQ